MLLGRAGEIAPLLARQAVAGPTPLALALVVVTQRVGFVLGWFVVMVLLAVSFCSF